MSWTTDDLLKSAKLRAFEPESNGRFTDSEWLRFANDELQSDVFPLVLSAQGDYYVDDKDYSITASQKLYRVPKLAHSGRIKDVLYVDSNGDEYSLPQVNLEEIGHIAPYASPSPESLSFYLKGDYVGLHPTPSTTSGTLRIRYYRRPAKLVATSEAMELTSLVVGSPNLLLGTPVSGWTTSLRFDIIGGSGTFRTVYSDIEAVTIDTTAPFTGIGIDDTTYDALIALGGVEGTTSSTEATLGGDWVAKFGESPIPQIPESVHPYLAMRTAIRALSAIGDRAGARELTLEANQLRDRLVEILEPRSDAEPKTVVPRYSVIRGDTGYRRWGRY